MTDAETIAALEAANDYQTGITNQLRRELTEVRLDALQWKQRAEASHAVVILDLLRRADAAKAEKQLRAASKYRFAAKVIQEISASVTR